MSNKFRSLTRTSYTQATDFALADVKNWLKMDDLTADDALITGLISTAVGEAEKHTGLVFGQAIYTAVYDEIYHDEIKLLNSPVISVEEVRGMNEDGTSNVLSSSSYYVVTGNNGSLNLKFIGALPYSDRCSAKYEIDYTVGIADGKVPQPIIDGVKIYVNDMYENRQSMTEDNLSIAPVSSRLLWNPFVVNII